MFCGEPGDVLLSFVAERVGSTPACAGVPPLFDHRAQDRRDAPPRIDAPTLVIGSDGSPAHPRSQRYIADRIPGARLHADPATVAHSHFSFLEHPPAFNETVGTFLSSTTS
jgi:pimeloyl-ACP methyl ester carboxylesterase